MYWVALQPLRGGSKSIPDKNIRPIAGRPLYAWSLEQALRSECFDEIYVSTDSAKIRDDVLREFPQGVKVIDRDAANAGDSASTESVMLEFQQKIPFDVLCLIQATSPLTRAEDFRAAKEKFLTENLDSLLSAVESKRFFWTDNGEPINCDPGKRPRRQDFPGCYMENGAFYLTRAAILQAQRSRLGGKIGVLAMPADTAIEIDEAEDWLVAEALLVGRKTIDLSALRRRIRALIVDVDGTLTDGSMYYSAAGEAMKKFDTRDAHGLQRLRASGVKVCVITAEDSPAVAARMRKLGIEDYHPGVREKLPLLKTKAASWGYSLSEVAYVGDDLGDLECLIRVGASFCPCDAAAEIRTAVDFISLKPGGNGAVREICDLILIANAASPP